MSPGIFEIVLREVQSLEPRVVVLYHGGEPFINGNILDMIRRIKSLGVSFVKTVTNGMLLGEEMLPKIVESGLDSITFSLDGTSPEENDGIRKGSDYRKVSSSIKRMIAVKRALNSDKPRILVANCQIPDEAQIGREEPVIAEYIAEDFARYDETEIEFEAHFVICWPGFPVDVSEYRLSRPCETETTLNYCEHPMELITVRHDGDVVACCFDISSIYVLGNIKRESISEIWNNGRYRALRKSIHDRKYLPLCENCEVVVRPHQFLVRR